MELHAHVVKVVKEGGALPVHGVHSGCLRRSLTEFKNNLIVTIPQLPKNNQGILVYGLRVYILFEKVR